MSFWDDIKSFTKPYAAEDDYEEFDDEMDEGFAKEAPAPRFSNRETAQQEQSYAPAAPAASPAFAAPAQNPQPAPAAATGFSGQVASSASSSKQQVLLVRPETFNDAPKIARELRSKKAVVLNLENVDKALARRVVDFLSGCAFSLDGSVKKVSSSTYMFCPYNMEIQGDLKNLQAEVENYI